MTRRLLLCLVPLLLRAVPDPFPPALHPWGGLVVDDAGQVYFTFICPFVDDDHYACIWQLQPDGTVTPVLQAERSPSDLVLARTPGRTLFAAERDGQAPRHRTRLWQRAATDWHPRLGPTTDPARFHVQAYAVADEGTLFFARDARLYRQDSTATTEVLLPHPLNRIDAMAWGPSGQLFLLDRSTLYVRTPDGRLHTRATGLKEDAPANLPFSGANILFDLTVAEDGTAYLAYYGNRRVLRVSPSGTVTTHLHAQAPWSPHGVDLYEEALYVLESTVGEGSWWKFWERSVIRPRIRKVAADGTVTVLFEYRPE